MPSCNTDSFLFLRPTPLWTIGGFQVCLVFFFYSVLLLRFPKIAGYLDLPLFGFFSSPLPCSSVSPKLLAVSAHLRLVLFFYLALLLRFSKIASYFGSPPLGPFLLFCFVQVSASLKLPAAFDPSLLPKLR